MSRKVLVNEEPTTPAMPTSARPIIRAPAVDAVRRGLRAALPWAIWPETPKSRAKGRPSTVATGRANDGLNVLTPMNTSTAPIATKVSTLTVDDATNSPMPSAIAPIAVMAPPPYRRRVRLAPARR